MLLSDRDISARIDAGDTDEQIEWFIDRLAAGLSDPASALLLDAVTASRLREDGALNFAEAAISVSAKKAKLPGSNTSRARSTPWRA